METVAPAATNYGGPCLRRLPCRLGIVHRGSSRMEKKDPAPAWATWMATHWKPARLSVVCTV